MHLDDSESEQLKKWIIKKLEDISDADSDVLADYVLALVKTEGPEPTAKANCIENLKDFLLDSAEPFVDELFLAITTKRFDPSRPPTRPTAAVYQPPRRPSFQQQQLPNESRKRSYHDWDRDEGANEYNQSYQGGGRPFKQPRRGSRGYEQRGGRPPTSSYGQSLQHSQIPQMPTPPPGMPPFDPNNPMAALLAMQQAMNFFPGMPDAGSPYRNNLFSQPPRQRCKDYDMKGYCSVGASCPYEHGNDSYIVSGFDHNQEYDPNNATLLNITPSRTGNVNIATKGRGRGGQRGRGRGGANWRGGGKRSEYAQMGPNRDRSVTSIVVESIPDDKCNEQSVRDFFGEFGDINEVTIQADKKLAVVKYGDHGSARTAYESPRSIFENRFVKVYWHKSDRMANHTNGTDVNHYTEDVEMQDGDEMDMEEFRKRQAEAQRRYDEARNQREDAEQQKQDLDAKLKAMEGERKKIDALLAKKKNKAESPTDESPTTNGFEESEQTKALIAQLAKLEAEAKSLGIDPDAPTNGFIYSPNYRGRGGYRGRGRGRGGSRGSSGGWSGVGRGAVMRLDNRPKTVAVTFVEGSYDTQDEALRQFLLFSGLDTASLSKHPDKEDTALVNFAQRYEGENFMRAAAGPELVHIGKVELSWYSAGIPEIITNGNHGGSKIVDAAEDSGDQRSAVRDTESYIIDDRDEDEDLDRWT